MFSMIMIQSRAGTLTAVAPQVLGRVALFQLPVTQKPHKMGPTSPGDKRHEQVSQPLLSGSQHIIQDNPQCTGAVCLVHF